MVEIRFCTKFHVYQIIFFISILASKLPEAEQKKATDELEARRKEVLASLGDVSKGGKTPKVVRIK